MFEEKGEDDLLSIAELAAWLGVARRTVENYRQHYPEKLPPAVGLPGRAVRYRVGAVRKWLLSREKLR